MASANFQHNLMNLQSNMLNYAYMLTSNKNDAHDLLQSATLNALVNEDKYTEGADFKTWIFGIMRNIFADEFASAGKTADKTVRLNLAREAMADDPEDCHAESDVASAINGLDGTLRVIMSMHLTGYSNAEIAHYTSSTVRSVRDSVRTGTRQLSARLLQA